jgi:uncharacterized protein YeaO (DUF488 family)
MLKSRPIKTERLFEDGRRISVMSLHTKSDRSPDKELEEANGLYDEWRKDLAPPLKLVGDWYKYRLGPQNTETFQEEFRPRYLDYLASHKNAVMNLAHVALCQDVTVMCIEPTPMNDELLLCHRRLLVEQAKLWVPNLLIHIE